jgi:predicted metal-binding membrane protein
MPVSDVGEQQQARPSSRKRTLAIWPAVLVFAAWTVALLAVLTRQTAWLDHRYLLTQGHLPWLVALLVFLASWQVMTVAMMLPSSLPLVYMMVHAGRRQRHPWTTQVAFLAGYAIVWTAFACAAFLGDTLVHWLVGRWFWLETHSWLIGAATFALAGSFQFSPLKEGCLKRCRSPFSFFVRYYQRGIGAAWHLGLRHGTFCLGCCWALMLVMFGLGVGSLVWMAVLTGVMVVERTYPGGERLRPVLGVVLLSLSVLWLVHPTWLLAGSGV